MPSHIRLAAALLLLAGSASLRAQTAPRMDLAVSFLADRSLQANTGANFWAEGGSVELGADAFHGFGVAANVSGVHTASVGSDNVPLSLVTATFGPRYRWHEGHRISPYGEVLLGEADGFRSLFPSASGAERSASSLALQTGGGIDLRLTSHLAVRAIEASWLRTQLPSGTNDRQNSIQVGTGMVACFGR